MFSKGGCPICHGGGLIPFKNRSDAWLDCSCKQPEPERYHQIDASDFDYPCSDTFRAHTYQHTNQPDPGYIAPQPIAPPPQVIEHRHSDMSKQDYALLRNLEGQVKYLQTKLAERDKNKQDYY
uniref:Uncharacterized protein n=1 Tax=viral metagenome TaxID=1070528 RepID=A0A6M3IQL1_9ZZZZ